mgnify:CR=1 FL=1
MIYEIKHRWSAKVLFSIEAESLRLAVEAAVRSDSNLRGSDLRGSNLRDSDLRGSNLRGSNLSGSNLSGSNLRDSNLSGSNLRDSNLTPIRDDLWAVLSSAPAEVAGLRTALMEGKIDGSTYEGDCACLVGTLAKVRGCDYRTIPGLAPNAPRPAERFFMAIKPEETPDNNQFAALAVSWIDEWLTNIKTAFPKNEAK